jgi:uridine kinase
VLSDCFVLSLCGDSGAGKTTVSNLINSVVPYDKSLIFETDRYHRWERGDSNYLVYTHLNPQANNLSSLHSDVYKLVLGNDIYTVDYDHSDGKFTYNNKIESNEYMIICGLHTLYEKSLRDISDMKVYIDTESSLKTHWKVERDVKHRGASEEAVKKSIERRYDDYKEYIEPQKLYADILIRYYPLSTDFFRLGLYFKIKKELGFLLLEKMEKIWTELEISSDYLIFTFEEEHVYTQISEAIRRMSIPMYIDLKSGYDGIIQYIFLILLWNC